MKLCAPWHDQRQRPTPSSGPLQAALPSGLLQADLPLCQLQAALPLRRWHAALPSGLLQADLPSCRLQAALPLRWLHAALPSGLLQAALLAVLLQAAWGQAHPLRHHWILSLPPGQAPRAAQPHDSHWWAVHTRQSS